MNEARVRLAIVAFSAMLCAALQGGAAMAQDPGTSRSRIKLQAQDYLDIRALIDAYPRLLENCTNSGYDYADLFTEDGTFGVSSTWGGGVKIWFRGRDELAAAGGGGKNGCRTPSVAEYHINVNPTITATQDGAKATSTLLTITNATTERGDIVHWEGGYEDTFVKTPQGWRFKSRVHVWPEVQWTDRPEDMPPRNLADE